MARFQTLNELSHHFERPVSLEVADPGVPLVDYDAGLTISPASVWKTQPAVRTVVDFIASNIASIPLHSYEHTDEGRVRDRTSQVAKILLKPSSARELTPYRFWKSALTDWLLWDRAVIHVERKQGSLRRVPPRRVKLKVDEWGVVKVVRLLGPNGAYHDADPGEFLLLTGYSSARSAGVSPVETLQGVLAETTEALAFRSMMWKRQATHTGVVQRSEPWDNLESRKNFLEGLRAFDAKSERAGGTMLLDEGMEWKDRKPSFTPADLEDIEARKLTVIEVCSMYHVAPEMVGARQGNYSNMEAFRQSLYRDNLGPYITGWEQAVAPLVEDFHLSETHYVEAFLDAKLRGSFEEQAKIGQTAVGAPTMTRNEWRAKMNQPSVPGGDELITPLNVLIGGQASPADSGTQNEKAAKSVSFKAASPLLAEKWQREFEKVLSRFFGRQEQVIKSVVGAKADSWWDQDRWDTELQERLAGVAQRMSGNAGAVFAAQLGFDPEDFDAPRTYKYLEAVSRSRAGWINSKTRRAVEEALAADEPVGDVFKEVRDRRLAVIAAAFAAAVAGWVAEETGRQLMPGRGWKTWVVTSSNPRASHAALNGETVPIDGTFSNGAQWPGDPAAGVDEVAGCMCGVEVTRLL